jgi:hypothetical protein
MQTQAPSDDWKARNLPLHVQLIAPEGDVDDEPHGEQAVWPARFENVFDAHLLHWSTDPRRFAPPTVPMGHGWGSRLLCGQ